MSGFTRVLFIAATCVLSNASLAVPITDTVTADGREWAQPDLFNGLSWNRMNTICPGGVCGSGQLNGFDMAGWRWASLEETFSLFNFYIGSDALVVGGAMSLEETDAAWASAITADGWRQPVFPPPIGQLPLAGLTSSLGNVVSSWSVLMRDNQAPSTAPDLIEAVSRDLRSGSPFIGGFFYTDSSTPGVPMPSTPALILLALAWLCWPKRITQASFRTSVSRTP